MSSTKRAIISAGESLNGSIPQLSSIRMYFFFFGRHRIPSHICRDLTVYNMPTRLYIYTVGRVREHAKRSLLPFTSIDNARWVITAENIVFNWLIYDVAVSGGGLRIPREWNFGKPVAKIERSRHRTGRRKKFLEFFLPHNNGGYGFRWWFFFSP